MNGAMGGQATAFKPCFIIPIFNHDPEAVVLKLTEYPHPLILVDDGSAPEFQQRIVDVCTNHAATLVRYEKNGGKGFAVKTALKEALRQGFSHAFQIDADMQHDLQAIDGFLACSQEMPEKLISGYPKFDTSVPTARKIGRYATHIWVWINTCSLQIMDTMCGFRIYPLREMEQVLQRHSLGNRMDFDIDVMVQFFRSGHQIHFLPCAVNYPEDGKSHFQPFADNVRISLMHARHFFTLPLWWWRRLVASRNKKAV